MPKEYEITRILDFASVPDDRLSDCIQEFVCCLFEFRRLQSETGFAMDQFTWVDDGIPGIQEVRFPGPEGEETIANPNFKR